MENFIKSDIDFEDTFLSTFVQSLRRDFERQQDNFVFICKDVYRIWSYCKGNYWKATDNEYYNSYKLLEKFGFDKTAVTRYKQCYERFIVDSEQRIALILTIKDFSPSKLFELLSLSQETVLDLVDKKLILPDMTVKQIREYIKTLRNGSDKTEKVIEDTSEINEEEITMAYDPKEEYEYSYFESKTKNQLLNIIWELQNYVKKLKRRKNQKND